VLKKVHRQDLTPSGAVIEIRGVVKDYGGLRPLRLAELVVREGERVAISGLDATTAEVLVNLINGAILPDEGEVRVFGQPTRDIASETAWLASLERFGIVSSRAILLDGATILQNLALPLTLEIDAVPPEIQERVTRLAARVGLGADHLPRVAGETEVETRMRVRLAKTLALSPRVLLLEHPTLDMPQAAVPGLAHDVLRVIEEDGVTTLVASNDEVFCGIVAGRTCRLDAASGRLRSATGWRSWFRS
jgi:ABC-type transporter Mla maintaining outer membrane lipid asymmetry ATPase subunit MlaF